MAMDLSGRIEEWRSQLLDTTKRNRLINLNLGRTGALKLVHPSADRIWDQLVAHSGTMLFPLKYELVGESGEVIDKDSSGKRPAVFESDPDGSSTTGRIDLSQCLESPRLLGTHLLTDMSDKLLKSRLNSLA